MPKSSPICDYQPSPQQAKEMGVEVVSKGDTWAKRSSICPLFSFPGATTCNPKPPSNKLKEPWKVVGSIINQTHVSPGLPGRSRGFPASSTASQGHLAVLSTWMWPGGPGEAQWCPCDTVAQVSPGHGYQPWRWAREGTVQALHTPSEDPLDFAPNCLALETSETEN